MSSRNLVLRVPRLSRRISRRALIVAGVAVALLACCICVFTAFGTQPLSIADVVDGVLGRGSRLTELTVREFRLPRILQGALVGGALGVSGAIFQSLSRNGLVSPDIIGINAGAAAVAVAIITTGTSLRFLPLWAFLGAIATAVLVYLAAVRHRQLAPYRLVLVGIAVNATLGSVTTFLILRSAASDLNSFASAQRWLLGSVNPANWSNVRTLALVLAATLAATVVLARHLEAMQLSDDAARGLGVRLELDRLGLVVVGSLLAATAVAFAGPIGFVAFAAPHVARRLVSGNHLGALICAGLVGALMLCGGDYVARRVIEPSELPVGAVTTILFCPYFLYLLYQANRQGDAL